MIDLGSSRERQLMSKYDGMTVNERLFVAGLTGQFHQAVLAGDRNVTVRMPS